jgi:hypothetical protein
MTKKKTPKLKATDAPKPSPMAPSGLQKMLNPPVMRLENFAHVPGDHPAGAYVNQARTWLEQQPVDGDIPATHPAYWMLDQASTCLAAQPLPEASSPEAIG